jgi:nucleotide-binding universal stress UspA family protein
MARLVICGVDDSAGAREAVRVAAGLAEAIAGELLIVHVATVPVVPGVSGVPGGAAELAAHTREGAERALDRIAEDAGEPAARRRVELGPPVETLGRIAAEDGAALLVVGSRGQGHLRAAVLGSVSTGLCRSAPCPVVVVPPSATLLALDADGAAVDARP